jgi:SAM-dependent methyltransferase
MEALIATRGAVATAGLVRRFRLTNPFLNETREFSLHDVQAQANLPFLLLMAVHLKDIMKREGLERILFTTRDSCLLQPIFELLFPDTDSHTFHTSRIAYSERHLAFVDYVKRIYIPGRTIIFDLHGAFKSGRDLFQELFGILPRVHIFSCSEGRAVDYSGISFDVKRGSNWTETLNLDRVGPLIGLDSRGRAVRAPISASLTEVGALYRAIAARFVESLRPHLDIVRCELMAMDRSIPWDEILRHICDRVYKTPAVPVGEATLEHHSLTQLMNDARSDKGSTYACAHGYTYIYEHLLRELAPRRHLSILEIGLNRAGESDIPSLRTWRKYLGNDATLYGVDISPSFLCHHDPAAGINILVADQSDTASLVSCGLVNPLGYDMIIDDGSHISSHQQISLRTLWQFLRPGGIYIIEDLHYQPKAEPIMETREMLRMWKDGVPACTPHIGRADCSRIMAEICLIELHDSRSQRWGDKVHDALAVIRKDP